jgi:PAS domain S-box-containing protein
VDNVVSREQYVEEQFTAYLHFWATLCLWVGALVILALVPLDYVAVPGQFRAFLLYRVTAAAILVLLHLVNKKRKQRVLQNLSVTAAGAVVAAMIAAMVRGFHGHESPYFAGFILVAIFVSGIIPMSFAASVAAGFLVYAIYLVPILVYDTITNMPYFLSANFLLLAAIMSLLLLQYLRGRQTRKEFGIDYDRRLAEARLEARERQLAESQRIARIGSWERSLANDEVRWSEELFNILGLDPKTDRASFEAFLDTVHPEDRESLKRTIQDSVRLRRPYATDCRLVLKDGRTRTIHAQGELVFDASHEPSALRGTAQDITDRLTTESAMLRSTRELNMFFEVALDLLCIADTAGRFRRLNRAWEQTLGYSREELQAGQFLDFVHPDDRASTVDAIKTLASQRQVLNFVNRYRCRDGSYRWIEWRSMPAGELIFAAARDITARRELETALRDREAALRSLLDAITESALLVDRDGVILAANETVAKRLGRGIPDLVGKNVYELLPADVSEHRRTHLDGVFRTGKPARFEDRRTDRIYDNSAYPVFNPDGAVIAVAIFGIDITDRRRAIEALLRSEEKYRTLYNSAIDAIFILDMSGKFIDVNRTAHERLGYSRDEMLSMNVSELDPPEYASQVAARIGQLQKQGQSTVVSAHIRKDGTIMPVEINAQVIDYEGERAIFSIVRDISERRFAEQERERLIADLQKALAEIKTLHGVLPICANCKKIRDEEGAWHQLEVYISRNTDAMFSHGLCMDCAKKLYPDFTRKKS